ncbi:GGDEF domain-containing protein [Rhodoferax aquaticus]|uniref:GGDEF domain-containing protein n=1 Tax=Rhodoferax aquaticus TaxID=2527691 RepID=A0A515EJR7_9BURK|nr:GGDEF domain-containing protein [Rhodoferax aquaticus]QDL52915.1 GGDEF domain-containing protein [Rhodoferax aquaticus]
MDYVEKSYFQEELGKSNIFKFSELMLARKGNWIEATNDEAIVDQSLISALNEKPKSGYTKLNLENECVVFFWLAKNQLVVKVKVKKATRASTIESMLQDLKRILKAANLEYAANHDSLTGLLNRNGVKLGIEQYFQRLSVLEDDQNIDQSTSGNNSVAVFSFDIDHFKQVNDTFGHGVGDSILRIFSSRLKHAKSQLEKSTANTFILSRPGGEEFELISIGSNHRTQLNQISELILKTIRTPSIPTDQEISEINPGGGATENFPKKILASIGVAHEVSTHDGTTIESLMDNVRKKADLALYRAKNDGRDCVRYFDDISLSHGRVIEYHPASDIAVIDIGRTVNVKPGDLYQVYYPPFTGDKDCFIDDGRSKKRLGSYIPIESAKIRVLNAQENISTCLIVSRQTDEPIPTGALLRRVPLGSKPIFVEPRHQKLNIAGSAKLVENVQDLIARQSLLAVLYIFPGFPPFLDLEARSLLLADFAAAIHMIFPSGTEIFAGDGFNVYVTLKVLPPIESEADPDPESDPETDAQSYIESLIKKLETHTKSRVGIFMPMSTPAGVNITADIALHFARAALVASADKPLPKFFKPSETLAEWKNRGKVEECLADYKAFKSYGVTDSSMENQLGLSILAADDPNKFPLADIAFGNAHSQEPKNQFFAANAALTKARLGKFDEAYKLLSSISFSFFERNRGSSYAVTYGKSSLEMEKIGNVSTTDFHSLLPRLFPKGMTIGPNKHQIYRTWMKELREVKLAT